MTKKLCVLTLTLLMLFSTSLCAFASEVESNDDATITPYDSLFILNLSANQYTSIYSDSIPILLPTTLTVTNAPASDGILVARIINDEGKILISDVLISAGDNHTFVINPDLLGLGQTNYVLQVKAYQLDGTYAVTINKGNQGEDIRIVSLNTTDYTYVTQLTLPSSGTTLHTITNNAFSPGNTTIRFIGADTGEDLTSMFFQFSAPTITPGYSVEVALSPAIGQNVLVYARGSVEGNYFIAVE